MAAAATEAVRLTKAALDETSKGDIVLRGVLDPKTFHLIGVDTYQREILPLSSLSGLVDAFAAGAQVPDVTLGMRGGGYVEHDGAFTLRNDTYVIDGLQRLSAAAHVMRTARNPEPHLGAVVYFNTTRASECDLFRVLNTSQAKLSPGVLLRNLKDTNTAIDMLIMLCHDKSFALAEKVCWNQRMKRSELITAMSFLRAVNILHSTFGPGLSSRYDEAARGSEKIMRTMGRTTMRDNTKTFFEVIDSAFGIRSLSFKQGATHLKGGFLTALALVLAHHRNFWDSNKKLVIAPDMRRKLATFPINDNAVRSLATSNQKGQTLLYRFLIDHFNKGKHIHRLVPFKKSDQAKMAEEADVIEDDRASRREIVA